MHGPTQKDHVLELRSFNLKTYSWNVDDVVKLVDLEVENCLEHVVDDIDVELKVLLIQVVIKLQESSKQSESRKLVLILQDAPDELRELLVSNILQTISVLEVIICPLDKIDVRCKVLSFVLILVLW